MGSYCHRPVCLARRIVLWTTLGSMSMSTARAVGTAPGASEESEAARREGGRKNALWISARVGGRRPPRSRAWRRTRRPPAAWGERGRARAGRDGSARGAHMMDDLTLRGGRRRARGGRSRERERRAPGSRTVRAGRSPPSRASRAPGAERRRRGRRAEAFESDAASGPELGCSRNQANRLVARRAGRGSYPTFVRFRSGTPARTGL